MTAGELIEVLKQASPAELAEIQVLLGIAAARAVAWPDKEESHRTGRRQGKS